MIRFSLNVSLRVLWGMKLVVQLAAGTEVRELGGEDLGQGSLPKSRIWGSRFLQDGKRSGWEV